MRVLLAIGLGFIWPFYVAFAVAAVVDHSWFALDLFAAASADVAFSYVPCSLTPKLILRDVYGRVHCNGFCAPTKCNNIAIYVNVNLIFFKFLKSNY